VRLASFVGLLVATMLALAPGAATKEDARARLTTVVPLGAAPGAAIRVGWTVSVPDGKGGREPFGATNMFVRLLSRTGAAATTGFAAQTRMTGRYAAQVKVPEGGIGGIRMGLRGTTDVTFAVENDPFRSPGGLRCDVATTRALLAAFVGAYNRGDLRRLDRLFSRDRFLWYSAGEPGARLRKAAFNRRTLMSYFRERHRRGDRLVLTASRFNGYDRARDLGHFELRARRRADDFRAGRWFEVAAKGAVDCAAPPIGLAVLSLGTAEP
jgi:hypothetical protein